MGKKVKFDLFENLFLTIPEKQPEMTETMNINILHAHLRKKKRCKFPRTKEQQTRTLLKTCQSFSNESTLIQKHKLQPSTNGANLYSTSIQNRYTVFLKDCNECLERAFGDNTQHIIDNLLFAKLLPHLRRLITLAYLEKGTHGQIMIHFDKENEHIDLENDGELPVSTRVAGTPNDTPRKTEKS